MKIGIIAGEASGDRLGADLMAQLPAQYFGIGGALMESEGLQSLFPSSELSVMGIGEVLPKLPHLLRRIRQTAQAMILAQLDVLITIDSPDFCHRVSRIVKKSQPDLPIIHYVAPSVWAWRKGRAKKIARYVDHVLCLLPFEPAYMHEAGMSADFVGHPIAKMQQPEDLFQWKSEHGAVLAIYPGSRKSECKYMIPIYQEFLQDIDFQGKIMIPALSHLEEELRKSFPQAHIIGENSLSQEAFEAEKHRLLYGADFAVATSGTVSLEIAWANTPLIIGYQTGKLTAWIYQKLIQTPYVSLPNILRQKMVIPEYLMKNCTPKNLIEGYEIGQTAEFQSLQKQEFQKMREAFQAPQNAAMSVMNFLKHRQSQ